MAITLCKCLLNLYSLPQIVRQTWDLTEHEWLTCVSLEGHGKQFCILQNIIINLCSNVKVFAAAFNAIILKESAISCKLPDYLWCMPTHFLQPCCLSNAFEVRDGHSRLQQPMRIV